MLAFGCALISDPKIVLLDEVSMGLSPHHRRRGLAVLTTMATTGVAMLLVEQYVRRAMTLAESVVILDRGSVVFSGAAGELHSEDLARSYLGAMA
jgi:branched-chain amino acid transport system ATP-binding protein